MRAGMDLSRHRRGRLPRLVTLWRMTEMHAKTIGRLAVAYTHATASRRRHDP